MDWRIEPLGDTALIVAFESRVDPAINRAALAAAEALSAALLPGVVDVAPAFCTVAVHYRPEQVGAPAPYEALCQRIDAVLAEAAGSIAAGEGRVIEIPVCYGGAYGPDLDAVAVACGLSAQAVIDAHVASPHVVYMLGFAPGLPYIGGLDPRLSLPRRATPRTRIAVGTVGIAREQSVIYSLETPGGWNLIGRTPLRLFDASAEPPCLLRPGDRVRFVPIDAAEFTAAANVTNPTNPTNPTNSADPADPSNPVDPAGAAAGGGS